MTDYDNNMDGELDSDIDPEIVKALREEREVYRNLGREARISQDEQRRATFERDDSLQRGYRDGVARELCKSRGLIEVCDSYGEAALTVVNDVASQLQRVCTRVLIQGGFAAADRSMLWRLLDDMKDAAVLASAARHPGPLDRQSALFDDRDSVIEGVRLVAR